jgi:hypothetical protein
LQPFEFSDVFGVIEHGTYPGSWLAAATNPGDDWQRIGSLLG